MLVLSGADVRALLPPEVCYAAMRDALAALADGEVQQPAQRPMLAASGAAGLLAFMPSYASTPAPAYGLKAVCVFPGNTALGLDAHQGLVILFDGRTGVPAAILDAATVTELRTPAVTAVATGLLARPDAADLTIVGSGVQGAAHARALAGVRPFRRIRIVARDPGRGRAVCAALEAELGLPVEFCASAEEAVASADVVVTATTSRVPVLSREWIRPGTHVNAIGSSVPATREIDTATMAAATVFADSAASAVLESGDYLLAAAEADVTIRASIGDVLVGRATGRTSAEEITVFTSIGLAVEDLFAAERAVSTARARGLGTTVAIGHAGQD
jgi:ornithine cyclodeaminase/alanine dehydrogenase-like protein (mu-crystallin family)